MRRGHAWFLPDSPAPRLDHPADERGGEAYDGGGEEEARHAQRHPFAGEPSIVEDGDLIHRSRVPEHQIDRLEQTGRAAPDAEREGEGGNEERADEPRAETCMRPRDRESYRDARSGGDRDRAPSQPQTGELDAQRVRRGRENLVHAVAPLAASHRREER